MNRTRVAKRWLSRLAKYMKKSNRTSYYDQNIQRDTGRWVVSKEHILVKYFVDKIESMFPIESNMAFNDKNHQMYRKLQERTCLTHGKYRTMVSRINKRNKRSDL